MAMRPDGPPVPKPYAAVPLVEGLGLRTDPGAHRGHDRFTPDLLVGRLEGTCEALSPVHVGSGGIERTARVAPDLAAETPLLLPLVRAAGRPVLPGPTLKGAVRAVVEAVTLSCLAVGRPTSAQTAALRACTRRSELCVACRLFGALGYQGRVRFADAPLVAGQTTLALAPALYQPRAQRGAAPPGRKFYRHGRPARGTVPLEVCPVGARFRWRLDFANLRPDELGLLLLALGQGDPPLWLKLGGYKPACFGSVQLTLDHLTLDEPAARYLTYADADAVAAEIGPPDVAPYLQALAEGGLVLADRLERLAAILRYPGDGDCPAGVY
ncbi:MAG TPA: RAMP superfamily CRISPR-associated protein [Chloroflexota bacterium]|nr:RAMP superfamily CRISPR-associated protein [Chloroflexota bacterium]